jgi:ubiquinone/menaquinone biosynthesis C-methylase UbiE
MANPKLKLLPSSEYIGVNRDDPIRFYSLPVFGGLYRRRVECCLAELSGGGRILEIGYGSGVTFLNLSEMYQEVHGLDLTADAESIQTFYQQRGVNTHLRKGSILEMPYLEDFFDSVLLISILEHLQPGDQARAFGEIARVMKPGGQVVFGIPCERPLMRAAFYLLGYDIRQHHFSTEADAANAARSVLHEVSITGMPGPLGLFGNVYEIGHFRKPKTVP